MSKTMKRRIFSGAICEQIIYQMPDNARSPKEYDPEKKRERFKTPEEYAQFKTAIARKKHYRAFQANFHAGDLFSTLTFDNEWEVSDWKEAKKVRSQWTRVLRKAYPDAVVFLYMGRGKSTSRIHFHMVSHGIPQDFIEQMWKYGSCKRIVQLRKHCKIDDVDCGQDYSGLANYLFNHWKPEQGGHRYYKSKNARKPEAENATEVKQKRMYSPVNPPKAPKGYRLTVVESSSYGVLYFRYVADEYDHPHRKGAIEWE